MSKAGEKPCACIHLRRVSKATAHIVCLADAKRVICTSDNVTNHTVDDDDIVRESIEVNYRGENRKALRLAALALGILPEKMACHESNGGGGGS